MISNQPFRSLMASTYRLRTTCPPGTKIASVRRLHRTPAYNFPRKDTQDKDSLNPQRTEYSQSGAGDDAAAHTEKAAFDPNQTRPEEISRTADQESGEVKPKPNKQDPNPLDVSGANRDVSKPNESESKESAKSPSESGESSDRARTSGRGSAPKHGGNKSG